MAQCLPPPFASVPELPGAKLITTHCDKIVSNFWATNDLPTQTRLMLYKLSKSITPNCLIAHDRTVVPNWGSKTKFSGVPKVIFEGESLHVLGCNFFQKRVIFMKAC